jgi:hypothetical protein
MTESLKYDASSAPSNTPQNRGYDTRFESSDPAPLKVTLQTIDEIIVNYFSEVIKPNILVSENTQRVPVIYGSMERWSTFRKDGYLRAPGSEKALTPMIMIRRTSMERGNLTNPSNKYVNTSYEIGWNARTPYDKFTILNGIKPPRQFQTVIIPDYVDITYDVVVWTEYEEQMSDLISQIQVESDEYWGERNNFKFRVKIDTIDNQTELQSVQDRIVRSVFSMKVGAYLIPERMVKDAKIVSTNQKIYTAKKVITIVEVDTSKNQA